MNLAVDKSTSSIKKISSVLFFLILILTIQAEAQELTVSGVVRDSTDHAPLIGANVILKNTSDTTKMFYAATDKEGSFRISGLPPDTYFLTISYIGYRKYQKKLTVAGKGLGLGTIYMAIRPELMGSITVTGHVVTSVQKGDTVLYNSNAFKTNPDASAQDLIKKMPGITVVNGQVQAQGEAVQKVLVDGKEFFGGDPATALNNLPADAIAKVEVFDKKSDQAQFTGFDDGNAQKTINIVTKPDKRHSHFGKVYAGYGTDERRAAGGNINFFNGDQRISVIGMSNNVNQQNFSTQDLLGVVGASGQGGGGWRARRQTRNFRIGSQSGITTTHSLGINYNDNWGKKVEVNGSYFFNMSKNNNDQTLNRTYFLSGETNQYYNEDNLSSSDNYNHRLNMRIDYKMDDHNSLLIRPRLSIQKNTGSSGLTGITYSSQNQKLNQSVNTYSNDAAGYNFSNRLLFRHSFAKRGRTFSVRINTGLNKNNQSNYQEALSTYYQQADRNDTLNQHPKQLTNGYSLDGRIEYTEPLGKTSQLAISYDASYNRDKSNKRTLNFDPLQNQYAILDTALSNKYNSNYVTNAGELSYRYHTHIVSARVGVSYQRSDLSSDQTYPSPYTLSRSYLNLLPNAGLRIRFSDNTNLRIRYRADVDAPSVGQLQGVVDNSNPLLLSTGNPNLKQEYSNQVSVRFSHHNPDKAGNFFAWVSLEKRMNYVGTETIIAANDTTVGNGIVLNKGAQLRRPVNMDGYLNARTFLNYGFPVNFIESNLNMHTTFSYSRTPGIINQHENFSNSYSIGQGLVIGSNISEKIDFTISADVNYNIVRNSIQPQLNNHYLVQSAGLRLNWTFWKGFVWGNDLNQQAYHGLGGAYDQNYTLWNMTLGKKFLKDHRAEISVTVYDLLNQNNSISRNVTDSYIENQQTQTIHRYFLFSLSYKI